MKASLFLAMTALAGSAAVAQDRATVSSELRVLHVPDEIAPAVAPYVACLRAARGASSPTEEGTAAAATDSTCSAIRKEAQRKAEDLLRSRPPKAANSTVDVTATLVDIEQYVQSLPVSDQEQAAGQPAGLAVTMDDEVYPSYAKYWSCLESKVRGSAVTAETVLAKFDEALAACNADRGEAVNSAQSVLAVRRPDPAERQKLVDDIFNRADQSWRIAAQNLRFRLLRKPAPAANVQAAASTTQPN